MRLTYDEALAHWARYGGPKPIRTGAGAYAYRCEVAPRDKEQGA